MKQATFLEQNQHLLVNCNTAGRVPGPAALVSQLLTKVYAIQLLLSQSISVGLGRGQAGIVVRPPEAGAETKTQTKSRFRNQIPGYQIQAELQGQGPCHKPSHNSGVRNQIT